MIKCSKCNQKFNLESPEEQQACFHYSNLQPWWAEENYCKGKNISFILFPFFRKCIVDS